MMLIRCTAKNSQCNIIRNGWITSVAKELPNVNFGTLEKSSLLASLILFANVWVLYLDFLT